MKILFIAFICFIYNTVDAQTINFKIEGETEKKTDAKFAYLTTLTQQIPISSDKLFLKVPIVDGKFTFEGNWDLDGKNFRFASIFLDERGNISKEEVALKFKKLIWVSGRDSHIFKMILENFGFTAKNQQDILNANITKGGMLNKDYKAYLVAAKAGRSPLIEFIKSHTNSPVSLHALQSLSFKEEVKDKPGESIEELFYKLSPKIVNSPDGQAVKKSLKIK